MKNTGQQALSGCVAEWNIVNTRSKTLNTKPDTISLTASFILSKLFISTFLCQLKLIFPILKPSFILAQCQCFLSLPSILQKSPTYPISNISSLLGSNITYRSFQPLILQSLLVNPSVHFHSTLLHNALFTDSCNVGRGNER